MGQMLSSYFLIPAVCWQGMRCLGPLQSPSLWLGFSTGVTNSSYLMANFIQCHLKTTSSLTGHSGRCLSQKERTVNPWYENNVKRAFISSLETLFLYRICFKCSQDGGKQRPFWRTTLTLGPCKDKNNTTGTADPNQQILNFSNNQVKGNLITHSASARWRRGYAMTC